MGSYNTKNSLFMAQRIIYNHHFEKAQVESHLDILATTHMCSAEMKTTCYLTFHINAKGNFNIFNQPHWLAYRHVFIYSTLTNLLLNQNFHWVMHLHSSKIQKNIK